MEITLLVGLVMAITQVIKNWRILKDIPPFWISVIVSIAVIAYKALEFNYLFNLELLGTLILVIIGANGGYKIAQRIAGKK